MAKFPDPIKVPSSVYVVRQQRLKQLLVSSSFGVLLRSLIILAEFIGVLYFGSSALLMDALAGLVDVLSSIVLIISIRLAARPPDRNHPFGHGSYEPLVGLQLGLAMVVVGSVMFFQQGIMWSSGPKDQIIDPRAWIIPFCAVIILEICYQIVMRTAKRQDSPALAADAFHYRIDSLTSIFATVALLGVAFFPHWGDAIDHFGAIIIAIFMIVIGLKASRQNLDQIMHRKPEASYFERVKKAAKRVEGVRETEKIRIQLSGPDAHIDIDIEVDPQLSVVEAHKISQKVRVEIQKEWPFVQDVTVHIEPFYPNDH